MLCLTGSQNISYWWRACRSSTRKKLKNEISKHTSICMHYNNEFCTSQSHSTSIQVYISEMFMYTSQSLSAEENMITKHSEHKMPVIICSYHHIYGWRRGCDSLVLL